MNESTIEILEKACPRCGGKSANSSSSAGRCRKCLGKLASNKKKRGHYLHNHKIADDAIRRQKGKNGTANKKSKGNASRKEIIKKVKTEEKKSGQVVSLDRKDNSKGYTSSNVRGVKPSLNRGRHHVDPKKLAAWRKKLKKNELSTADLKLIVMTRVLQVLEKKKPETPQFQIPEAGSRFAGGASGSIKLLSPKGDKYLKTGETNRQLFETINDIHTNDHGKPLSDKAAAHVKEAYPHQHGETTAQREHAYSNLADKFFGMGHRVAKTTHHKSGEIDYGLAQNHPHAKSDASVADVVPGTSLTRLIGDKLDKDVAKLPYNAAVAKLATEAPMHREVLKPLFESGEAHKLAVMDHVLGNWDRHPGNIIADEKGNLTGIDHGMALHHLDQHPNWGRAPGWISHFTNHDTPTKAKQEFGTWLDSLDHDKLRGVVKDLGFNDSAATAAASRLKDLKSKVASVGEPMEAFNQIFNMRRGVERLGDEPDAPALKTKIAKQD